MADREIPSVDHNHRVWILEHFFAECRQCMHADYEGVSAFRYGLSPVHLRTDDANLEAVVSLYVDAVEESIDKHAFFKAVQQKIVVLKN